MTKRSIIAPAACVLILNNPNGSLPFTTLFSQYDLKVLDVDSKVNEKGTIEKIDIKTDKLRHTKKLKTAISNFYNMKESNINISE